MDYEKLHKDTIAKLQEMVNSGKITVEIARGICADFVPEDEDERVRKAMIDFFKHEREEGIAVFHYGVNIERIIAWFEKQGEQKHVECCADKLWTEFQKQVAYLMASSYNREYEYTKGYVEWVAQSLLGYAKNEIEQNHVEWSDDDEAFLDDILCKVESNLLLNKDEKNWLKSIKDRVQPQPKQEWSEEDKRNLQGVIDEIEANKNTAANYEAETYDRFLNWLKSLRPHKQWTPSEGQMKLLREVQQALLGKDCHNRFVNFMYELKRLREE